ncbi:hypothetical protein G6L37_00385 [Agrobacterium rubi]|nr:hypothetical protein [Agrobacterium rubi]NTF23846.1 hypothetical protein [Agrobacterium rubi]
MARAHSSGMPATTGAAIFVLLLAAVPFATFAASPKTLRDRQAADFQFAAMINLKQEKK